jgi:large subunit ribosomal protein L30
MPQLIVIRISGTVNIRYDVKKTFELLKLRRRYSATIVPKNNYYLGMLNLAKDHVSWGELNFSTAKMLITKRGRTIYGKSVDDSTAKTEGFKSLDEMVNGIVDGSVQLNKLNTVKQYFNLAPPRGGFKRSTKKPYKVGGVLAENEEILSLVSRMV